MTPTQPVTPATVPTAIDPAPLELIRNTAADSSATETSPDGDPSVSILSAIRQSVWPD